MGAAGGNFIAWYLLLKFFVTVKFFTFTFVTFLVKFFVTCVFPPVCRLCVRNAFDFELFKLTRFDVFNALCCIGWPARGLPGITVLPPPIVCLPNLPTCCCWTCCC